MAEAKNDTRSDTTRSAEERSDTTRSAEDTLEATVSATKAEAIKKEAMIEYKRGGRRYVFYGKQNLELEIVGRIAQDPNKLLKQESFTIWETKTLSPEALAGKKPKDAVEITEEEAMSSLEGKKGVSISEMDLTMPYHGADFTSPLHVRVEQWKKVLRMVVDSGRFDEKSRDVVDMKIVLTAHVSLWNEDPREVYEIPEARETWKAFLVDCGYLGLACRIGLAEYVPKFTSCAIGRTEKIEPDGKGGKTLTTSFDPDKGLQLLLESEKNFKMLYTCKVCGKNKTKACGRCKKVRYCSIECQRKDLEGHKSICGSVGP